MFTCTACDYRSHTKLGKCPSCGGFGTFMEDLDAKAAGKKNKSGQVLMSKLGSTSDTTHQQSSSKNIGYRKKQQSFGLGHREFERVITGGVQQGGVYLLGGEPGIGKSTMGLQLIKQLVDSNPHIRIAYFSAEEHPEHILARWQRLFPTKEGSKEINTDDKRQATVPFALFHSHSLEDLLATSKEANYDLVVVDSIQTLNSAASDALAGSPQQVRVLSEQLTAFAKESKTALLIIGHVTKGGEIAGPKYLEHIVDVVLYVEGDKQGHLRFLRCKKNRFGPADDTGIFEMTLFGLQPVYDLNDRLLQQVSGSVPGSALSIGLDNGRPVLIQIEALLATSYGKFPSRRAVGVDNKRVDLLIAILEKYTKLPLGKFDVYINVPGEWSFADSGLDLAIAAAIMSQYHNKIISKEQVFVGEIGLSGHVRKATQHDRRAKLLTDGLVIVDTNSCKHIVELAGHL